MDVYYDEMQSLRLTLESANIEGVTTSSKKKVTFSRETPFIEDYDIKLSILKHIYNSDRGCVQYIIKLIYRGVEWVIVKRYNDFVALSSQLAAEHKAMNWELVLPILPKKRWFERQRWFNRLDDKFGTRRQVELQHYLRVLVRMPELRQQSLAFWQFICMPKAAVEGAPLANENVDRDSGLPPAPSPPSLHSMYSRDSVDSSSADRDSFMENMYRARDSILEVQLGSQFDDQGKVIVPTKNETSSSEYSSSSSTEGDKTMAVSAEQYRSDGSGINRVSSVRARSASGSSVQDMEEGVMLKRGQAHDHHHLHHLSPTRSTSRERLADINSHLMDLLDDSGLSSSPSHYWVDNRNNNAQFANTNWSNKTDSSSGSIVNSSGKGTPSLYGSHHLIQLAHPGGEDAARIPPSTVPTSNLNDSSSSSSSSGSSSSSSSSNSSSSSCSGRNRDDSENENADSTNNASSASSIIDHESGPLVPPRAPPDDDAPSSSHLLSPEVSLLSVPSANSPSNNTPAAAGVEVEVAAASSPKVSTHVARDSDDEGDGVSEVKRALADAHRLSVDSDAAIGSPNFLIGGNRISSPDLTPIRRAEIRHSSAAIVAGTAAAATATAGSCTGTANHTS